KDWAEEIIDAISSAAIVVLVLSSSSNDSPQVRREVERAVSKSVPVLPLRVEDVLLSKSLEYFISTQQWLDAFAPPFEMHLENLRICVLEVLQGPSTDGSPDRALSTTRASAESAATATASARPTEFSPRDLKYIETQLASYLGPVAKFLVSQAARKSSSIEELTAMLSAELKADGEQRSFRENCRFLEK
ncbi:MAG: toll/interleukin-1 receptor domain-containing protein, partial [Steroidobacteraceae bacterium]|nr:toll/interleukin-1 receptor domain-containing protein [Steroidobacteraceae bacterium]